MFPGFARNRLRLATLGQTGMTGRKSSDVMVLWSDYPGGEPDAVTGAELGGTGREWSGTMTGLVHQVAAETKLRQFSEIQVGDVLLDIDPAAQVCMLGYTTLASGTMLVSGTITLDTLDGVRFLIDNTTYTEAELGEELAQAWEVLSGNQRMIRTLHLRVAT